MTQNTNTKYREKHKIRIQNIDKYKLQINCAPKENRKAADVRTRELLIIHGNFHLNSNIQRLYMSRKEDEWNLVSVKATILNENRSIQKYINKMAPNDVDRMSEACIDAGK